eukprot:7814943-Karenia_brevis.AAC.1
MLKHLSATCPGISKTHFHESAWGSRKTKQGRVSLARNAGHYPDALCKRWSNLLALHFASWGQSL